MNYSTTIHDETLPTSAMAQTWLNQFPVSRRSTLANWFHYAVRAGHDTPAAVVQQVRATAGERLGWARTHDEEVHLRHVLACLDTDLQDAMAYANRVLAWEALPYDERQRQKAERAQHYQHQHMTQLPVTPKQLAYLRALGYLGPEPVNRAEASALIDGLVHPRLEVQHE